MSHRIVQIAKGSPDSAQFIEPELTNLSSMAVQSEENFIARLMAPSVPVQMQGGKYWEYSKADFNRDEMGVRADGAQAPLGGYRREEKLYWCEVFSLAKDVGPQERANNPRADRNAARYLTRKALIKGEVQFGAACWGTGKWSTEFTGKASPSLETDLLTWMDSDADPIEQLEQVIAAYELKAAGFPIRRLAFGRNAWRVFKNHPKVISRFNAGQTSGGARVTLQAVAELLEVERVLVAKAVKTTSAPGVAEASSSFGHILDGDGVLGLYTPDAPSMDEPSAAYHFDWNGYLGAGAQGQAIFEEEVPLTNGARRYTIEHAFESRLVAPDFGFWLEDILAAAA